MGGLPRYPLLLLHSVALLLVGSAALLHIGGHGNILGTTRLVLLSLLLVSHIAAYHRVGQQQHKQATNLRTNGREKRQTKYELTNNAIV